MKTMRPKAARPAIRRSATMRVCDVVVPSRVVAALGRKPGDDEATRIALLHLASGLSVRADVSDAVIVDDLVVLGLCVLQHRPIDGSFALRLLIACFVYFENIGRTEARLRLVEQVRMHVDPLPDQGSRHSAYRFLAIAALCSEDPKQAWVEAERAYETASGFETCAGRFEALIIVAQTLDSMGLLGDALTLALQLAEFPDGNATLDTLHLINATHGMSLGHRLDDVPTAGRFHDIARAKAASQLLSDSALVITRFEAMRAVHLVRTGRARAATRSLNKSITRQRAVAGKRGEALLRCAQAEVHTALGIEARMAESLVALKILLDDLPSNCVLRQDVVRAIVKLLLHRNADGDREVAMHYLHRLRDRPLSASGESGPASDLLTLNAVIDAKAGPKSQASQGHAPVFEKLGNRPWARNGDHRATDVGASWQGDGDDAPVLSRPELEAALRTGSYQAAEEWAIVAEIARGGDGRRCFKVGRVAAAVAAALGFSVERCVLIDLGCRLRDIGHATLVRSHGRHREGTMHDAMQPAVVAAHADTGARMLSFSADPVLRLATRIARSHHAWWNGSGYPGIGGEEIAIEGRICAVADTLIDLVDPIGSRKPWPIEIALRQMQCMAAVQLDPALVEVLGRILKDEGSGTSDPALRWESRQANDPFAQARKHLLEKLELAA